MLPESFSLATSTGLSDTKIKMMLSKLVSVRLHIGKLALARANEEDGGGFSLGDAKHAVEMLESAYDVLTNQLPASWMSDDCQDGGSLNGDPITRMELDGVEGDDKAGQDIESARHIQQNDSVHIEVFMYDSFSINYA